MESKWDRGRRDTESDMDGEIKIGKLGGEIVEEYKKIVNFVA